MRRNDLFDSLPFYILKYQDKLSDMFPTTDSYSTAEMTLQWFDEDPIEIDENLELPQFDLKGYYKHNCAMAYKTG